MSFVNHARRLGGRVFPALSSARRDPFGDYVRFGLFDLAYYRAQVTGADRPRSVREARRHYARTGRSEGIALHPLIEPEWWDPHANTREEDPLGRERWLIQGHQRGTSTSILIAEPIGPIAQTRQYLTDLLSDRARAAIPGGLSAGEASQRLTAALERTLAAAPNAGTASGVEWASVARAMPERVAGLVSVLVPTFQDWRMTVAAVRAALADEGEDIEVIVVDNGSRLAVTRSLLAAFLAEPRVQVIRCSVNTNFAGGMNRALAQSRGEYILLLNNDAVLEPGWRAPLIDALRDDTVRGSQPLLLYPRTRRVQAAGTMFLGEGVLPWHFLAGHPRADVERMTDFSFKAVTAAVAAFRATDLVAAEGFDEEFENGYEDVDLCLRLLRGEEDRFVLVPEAVAVHPEGSSPGRSARDSENRVRFFQRWAGRMPAPEARRYHDVGLELTGSRPLWFSPEVPITVTEPELARPPRAVPKGPAAGRPSLRWLLLSGDADPDAVDGFTATLARLGQEGVHVDGGTHPSDVLADVVVAFRDDAAEFPRSGAFNVLVGAAGSSVARIAGADDDSVLGIIDAHASWKEGLYPSASHD